MDDCSSEVLAIEFGTSLYPERIISTLIRIIAHQRNPKIIRTCNGPELASKDFELCHKDEGVENQYIQYGKPMQNANTQRFNKLYGEAILDGYLSMDLDEFRYLSRA